MGWNHRILAHEHPSGNYLALHEVGYKEDNDDHPIRYTVEPIKIIADDMEGITWKIEKIQIALSKPVMWAGKKFPQIVTEEELKQLTELEDSDEIQP